MLTLKEIAEVHGVNWRSLANWLGPEQANIPPTMYEGGARNRKFYDEVAAAAIAAFLKARPRQAHRGRPRKHAVDGGRK